MTENSDAQDWRTTLLPLGSTIQQAIYSLETSSMQIVLAVSEDNRLAGTLTDGDIRRAFLKGLKLESIIDNVIHQKPLAVPPEISRDLVLQIMKINRIHQLPIVDQDGVVVGLHVWDSMVAPKAIENMMLIMAGGKGTRLRPHTENCPKPMLEVGGKPMLQHIIEKASADGFQNFVISLHYLGHMVEEYFGDGSKYGVRIDYLKEETPLGTAGCLSLLPKIPELPFIVTNGDVITDICYNEFLDFHNRHEASATMAVRQHEIQNQFGVVRTRGVEIEGFEEKPVYRSHVNTGIYVLEPFTLKHLVYQQHCDMPTLFERVKKNAGRTIVYPMHETWLDVGRPTDLALARNNFSNESE
jgi:dTDP-glucose pyrophosphorylase/predicted transcriptional regulator